jgi:hypothetical protein
LCSNFLDEPRNIDVRGAGVCARRVEAHQAARCLDGGLVIRQRRQKFIERIRPPGFLLKFRQPSLLILIPG